MPNAIVLNSVQLPDDPLWLARQPCPVIAYGLDQDALNADVVVPDREAALILERHVEKRPVAAMTLVQVLRSSSLLPASQGLDIESLAYSTLQSGSEFMDWHAGCRLVDRQSQENDEPVLLSRAGNKIEAVLNRPASRNSMTTAMRDAWVEALQLLEADDSIEELQFRGRGDCFSVGGELREFGSRPDSATAHWVRTVHSPARLLAEHGSRVTFFLHGACIGSGIELPAFGSRVVAHPRSFFQLPELQLGLIPGAGGTVSIARRIGRQRLVWLVLSGKRINARTALAWGLVDELAESF